MERNKILVYIMMSLMMISLVSAVTFNDDTTFSADNLNVVFKEGITIGDFDVNSRGLTIDDQKFGFVTEGGQLDIIIHEYDGIENNKFELRSNIPQEITFSVVKNSIKYSFYDGTSYKTTIIPVDSKGINGSFVTFDGTGVERIVYTQLEENSWLNSPFIEFEIGSGDDARIVSIKNYIFIIFIILIVSMFYLIRRLSK